MTKIIMILILCLLTSTASFGEEPISQVEQCEQYGSFQDSEEQWQPCETEGTENEPSEDDDYENEPESDEQY